MPTIDDSVLDNLAGFGGTAGVRLDITSALATTYTEAITTYSLGSKTALTMGAVGNATGNGRQVSTPAILSGAPGTVSADGTASHWALTDGSALLYASGLLAASQAVTNANDFTLDAVNVIIRDPV